MEGDFPEEMKCPICFEIPDKEIYQCVNGHHICHICASKLQICPQCSVTFGDIKIRSRPLESMLDLLKFNCTYKKMGCSKKLKRAEIHGHSLICYFGGEQLRFCELIGLSCTFSMNSRNTVSDFEHLKSHKIKICTFTEATIRFKNFANFQGQGKTSFWTPVIFRRDPATAADNFIFLGFYNASDASMSFTCLLIRKHKGLEDVITKFIIKSSNPLKVKDIVWLAPAVPIRHVASEINLGFLRLPFPLLQDYAINGNLDLKCIIYDRNEVTQTSNVPAIVINVVPFSSINDIINTSDAGKIRMGISSENHLSSHYTSMPSLFSVQF